MTSLNCCIFNQLHVLPWLLKSLHVMYNIFVLMLAIIGHSIKRSVTHLKFDYNMMMMLLNPLFLFLLQSILHPWHFQKGKFTYASNEFHMAKELFQQGGQWWFSFLSLCLNNIIIFIVNLGNVLVLLVGA
jgi:hypothetical protein